MKPGLYQFLLGCFASIGSMLFGYDLAVIQEVVASDSFITLFLEQNGSVKSGTVVALFTGGAFFGAFAAGFCDPLGRRGTICMAACIFLVGGIIQTSGVVLGMLYAGRFIAGFGVGILCMIIPVFQAEISSHKIRGAITSLQQLFNAVGQIVAAWTGYGCYLTWHGTGNSKEWRIPLGIQMTPAIFLASMIYLFPESPRWLISHGKHEQGLEVLAKLHAHGDKDDPYVIAEYELIMGQVIEEKNDDNNSYARLFTRRSNLRRMILATFIQAECQMTGVSAIQYFAPQIYAEIGVSTSEALLFSAINAIIAFAGTSVEMLIVDRVGRRPLEIHGSWIMSMMFLIGTVLIKEFPASANNTKAHIGFIATTWIFNFVFFITSGPLSWAIPAELFTIGSRMKGVSIGAMTSFAFNTMVGQVTPVAITAIGWRYYILFTVTNLTNGIFFWAFLPETKGISLEEMEDLFENGEWFIPTSTWKPKNELMEKTEQIAHKGETAHVESTEQTSQV